MMEPLRRFEFPEKASFTAGLIAHAPAVDETEINAAIARGYEEGLERGRRTAVEELQRALGTAQSQGRKAGREEGFAEIQVIADTLRAALAANEQASRSFAVEAEHFCVELALAAINKLVEVDKVQTNFIKRAINRAVMTLAPRPPTEILVNPSVADQIKAAFPKLPIRAAAQIEPGQARIDGGRFLIDSAIRDAVAEIRDAIIGVRTRHAQQRTAPLKQV